MFEGYAEGGRQLVQERVGTRDPEAILQQVFGRSEVDYVHIRNGEAGCFMATVHRCFRCD